MIGNCRLCAYWRSQSSFMEGACRRHGPHPYSDEFGTSSDPVWPLTQPDDWCGDFEAKVVRQEETA